MSWTFFKAALRAHSYTARKSECCGPDEISRRDVFCLARDGGARVRACWLAWPWFFYLHYAQVHLRKAVSDCVCVTARDGERRRTDEVSKCKGFLFLGIKGCAKMRAYCPVGLHSFCLLCKQVDGRIAVGRCRCETARGGERYGRDEISKRKVLFLARKRSAKLPFPWSWCCSCWFSCGRVGRRKFW